MEVNANVFQIDEQKHLKCSTPTAFFDASKNRTGKFWMDVQESRPDALASFLEPLGLHPLVLEACLDTTPKAHIAPYEQVLYVQFPTQFEWKDPTPTFLTVVCLPEAIVTLHAAPMPVLNAMAHEFMSATRLQTASTSAVLYQILDRFIDQDLAVAVDARKKVDAVEEAIDAEAIDDLVTMILRLKRQFARLAIMFEDQHRCISTLQAVESDCFSTQGLREYFHDAISNLDHALRAAGRQEARLTTLHQYYLLKLQEKAGNRLRILTILSAVFLPLTLITGIYGMNFRHMPELLWPLGYPAVIISMIVLAGGMLWMFYRRGWFK